MDAANLPAFREQFDEVARARLSQDDLTPEVRVDLQLSLDAVGAELEGLVRHFEPFGIGNPAPMFAATGVRLASAPRRVGTDGVKLALHADKGVLDAIGWGMGGLCEKLHISRPVDVAFRLEREEYRGVSRLQLKLADLRP